MGRIKQDTIRGLACWLGRHEKEWGNCLLRSVAVREDYSTASSAPRILWARISTRQRRSSRDGVRLTTYAANCAGRGEFSTVSAEQNRKSAVQEGDGNPHGRL